MRIWGLLAIVCFSCSEMIQSEVKEGVFTSNGSEIYFRTVGNGDPVIIVHGGPVLDHSYLLPWMDELGSDYELVYYDQRACGKSSAEVDTSRMRLSDFVQDIENLRKFLGYDKIHVLGHSWGGLLAMKYAIEFPENLSSVVLSSPVAPSSSEWQEEQVAVSKLITASDSVDRANILSSGLMQTKPSEAIEQLMRLSFKVQFADTSKLSELQLFIPEDFMARSAAFSYLGPDLQNFDLYPELSYCEVPVLIVYGNTEPGASISGRHMIDALPEARMVRIPDSGHFPFIENPKEYFSEVRSFLSNHSY